MSREIQLSTNSPAAADFWTQGGAAALAPGTVMPQASAPAPVVRSPLKKAHRLLRGRYPLAIVLAAGCAAAGALAGYSAIPPKFESVGTVQINPLVEGMGPGSGLLPLAQQFMLVQTGLIMGPNVAEKAVQEPSFKAAWYESYPHQPLPESAAAIQGETFLTVWSKVFPHQPAPTVGSAPEIKENKFKVAWYETFPHQPLPSTADMIAAEDTGHAKGDGLIHLAFSDRSKAVAEAGARAIVGTYMAMYGNTDDYTNRIEKLQMNQNNLAKASNQIADGEKQLEILNTKFGTLDLGVQEDQKQRQLATREDQYNEARLQLDSANANGKTNTPQTTDRETIYLQIEETPDRLMTVYMQNRETAREKFREAKMKFSENHPTYREAYAEQVDAERRVDDYATAFLKADQLSPAPKFMDASADNVKTIQKRMELLKASVDDIRAQVSNLGLERAQIEKVRAQIADATTRRDAIQKTIDSIESERALTKNVILINAGSEAAVDDKKRKLAAGVGLLFGGMLPFGILMLYGLGENRFRYSDDANATDLSGVTLLGILPNLPDRLSDPQQAGVAAHCVHQIRTMLQISRSNDEPQVIAVTSAAPGDGKTSLTLALGLSYAACGARTLLVDCDLIAAGLTHRLNVSSPDGVLEAVANRALLEYVRTTDIADVAILPVGTTHAHHASTLSPVALRRLLSEAKKQFDIIIVDTGPILGSIEASLVCAASDRTILTVARNQQRPLVERSIGHLQAIGSSLAGVVFNRAQARDFEKSMSGLALRSRPPAPSGSTAKAVAGSFKRAG